MEELRSVLINAVTTMHEYNGDIDNENMDAIISPYETLLNACEDHIALRAMLSHFKEDEHVRTLKTIYENYKERVVAYVNLFNMGGKRVKAQIANLDKSYVEQIEGEVVNCLIHNRELTLCDGTTQTFEDCIVIIFDNPLEEACYLRLDNELMDLYEAIQVFDFEEIK